MTAWGTIESGVVQRLAALTLSGAPLLAVAKGATSRERRVVLAALGRERMPAAYVMATAREDGEKATRRAGSAAISVLLASRSERSDDEARNGGAGVTGVYTLSEEVSKSLQDFIVGGDRILLLVDERPVGGDEGSVVWEQRYEVRRLAELTAPTFGGVVLTGADSEVHVEVGELRRAASAFSFPGIDGVFERYQGVRERPITWRGQLRAVNDAGLNAIEAAIEDELRGGGEKTMVDSWGRTHELCVMKHFQRRGQRLRDELSGEALQDFEIVFEQLGR